uniref:AT-rich interactive domain-containing protein 3 n=1 Tax=Strigops habroptila TaxID=2489341 RepID=A0A672VBF0_STRHB
MLSLAIDQALSQGDTAWAVLSMLSIALSPPLSVAAPSAGRSLMAPCAMVLPTHLALGWDRHPCCAGGCVSLGVWAAHVTLKAQGEPSAASMEGALRYPVRDTRRASCCWQRRLVGPGVVLGPGIDRALSLACTGSTDCSLSCPQLYELDEDPKRKEFLDDLFSFMQKRGTPVNRIPIMAKQVLDLYTLYQLVTDKGGLVEVINKKIWREITKGLNLPTSITSAAFTLRTQYMKYLYPYECEKRALSSPGELQAAIDSNRREGRRQTFGTALFNYSPVSTPTLLGSPKLPLPALSISTHSCGQNTYSPQHAFLSGDGHNSSTAVPGRIAIPVGLAGHHLAAAQAAAASQAVVLEQLREKLETGEPPEKKVALTVEEQQQLVQHALQHNLLAVASQFPMNIKISNRGNDRQETALNLSTNGISSINMSIEINGVVYTGVLFARRPPAPPAPSGGSTQSRPNPMPAPNPLLPAPSHNHTPTSTSP